ncbi:hypothetical protein MMC14_009162 [Varicellaria rhodocarpa]|nr:hypothetical protein [Varicellaria rhodocarpa]
MDTSIYIASLQFHENCVRNPSGNYLIEDCGIQANLIVKALEGTKTFINQAIYTLDPDSPVYTTFLNGVDPVATKKLFTRIVSGQNYTGPGPYLDTRRPTLVCAKNPNDVVHKHCGTLGLGGTGITGTQFVVLCPRFWTVLNPWPIPRDCNTLSAGGTQFTGPNLAFTQYATLAMLLAQLYMDTTQGGGGVLARQAGATNEVIKLSGSDAARNPTSYALYLGNVKAGCTAFPQHVVRAPTMDYGHELLETDEPSGRTLSPGCADQAHTVDYFDDLNCPLL